MREISLKQVNKLIGFWESFSYEYYSSSFSNNRRLIKIFFWKCGCRGELFGIEDVVFEPCNKHYDLFMEIEIDDGITLETRKKILELFDR